MSPDDRLEQFRSALRQDALDIALCVQRHSQDVQHQGHSVEQIRRTLFDEVQVKVDTLDDRIRMIGDQLDGIAKTTDRNTDSQCASIGALIQEQKDIRQLVEGLAKLLDQRQETSGTMSSDASAAIQLEIIDLKMLRLTEQNTQQEGRLTFLASMSEQVNLIENQIIKWRYRLPELTDDDSEERVVSAVEVQEDLDEFKEVVLRKLKDLLTNLNALRGEVHLLEREKDESWEAVNHRVSTLVDDSVSALTERLSELERTVQSQKTTPITDDDLLQTEAWSTMEQAILSELGKVREQAQDRQIAGLLSFAKHVERFLAQTNQGATAPSNVRPTPVLALSVPKVSTPRRESPSSEPGKKSATHFSTVRSNVRSGAIRIDITNSEEWSAGNVAVIRK